MSTMRYVGARYVPKWYVNSVDQTADWEVNVEYEPLTWVTSQNNHLYLSKKTVPDNIGTPAQNTEYWLDMGQMTGDLQNIQDEIDAITANIGSLSNLDTTDKSSLVAAINEVVQGGGGSPASKKYVIFGDSYGTNYTSGGTDIVGWYDKLLTIMGIDPSQITHSYVFSGLGFIGANNDSTTQWKTVLNTYDADNEVTDVLFIGGDNDLTKNMSDVGNAITDTVTLAKSKYPNAKIWIGFCAIDFNQDQTHNMIGCYATYNRYGVINGAIIMDGLAYCLYNKSYMLNAAHPNNNGTSVLAGAIASALSGGTFYNGVQTQTVTIDTSDAAVTPGVVYTGSLLFTVDGTDLIFDWLGTSTHTERMVIKFTAISNYAANGDTSITIGKITNVPLFNQGVQTLGVTPCGFKSGGTWHAGSALFQIWNNYLQVRIYSISSSGYTVGSVDEIEFPSDRYLLRAMRGTRHQY